MSTAHVNGSSQARMDCCCCTGSGEGAGVDANAAVDLCVQGTAKAAMASAGPCCGVSSASMEQETPQQQKARESAQHEQEKSEQKTREAAQHAEEKRAQKEREDQEHGVTASGQGTPPVNGVTAPSALPPISSSDPSGRELLMSGNSASPATSVTPGTRSKLPAYSLDNPNLSAEEVKAYINDSVDRNWDQIRSSFNLSDTAADKDSAKAFFLGVASRESGTGDTMKTNLITGVGSSYSKGPLQTADTAYANNGHPEWNQDTHVDGIAQADLSESNDLSTAIDMGVRHMLEGAELGKLAGHQSTADLEIDAMAHHNTGHIEGAPSDPEWRATYAGQVMKMAAWYENGHLEDSQVVYFGQL
jgi:hypothetical protein